MYREHSDLVSSVGGVRDWAVAADDRTGAFEVAAELAEAVGEHVEVRVGSATADGPCVVDLGSRALSARDAAARAAALDTRFGPAAWTAHKIDSTLRGHWAAEVLARQAALRRPVVVLPAYPAMGRTCLGGVVHVDGAPVASVTGGLPAARRTRVDLLDSLDLDDVVWLDIADDADLAAAAAALAPLDALVAGPAGALGAAFRARPHPLGGRGALTLRPWADVLERIGDGPVLVVCGSVTEVAAAQLDELRSARPDVHVVATPAHEGSLLDRAHADAIAALVRPRLLGYSLVVIIGGDTAAAVLGDAPRHIGGYAAPGMPWSAQAGGDGPIVVTKAGGFGAPDALVRLLNP